MVISPILVCKYCRNKESSGDENVSNKDEVVYGEVRFPKENCGLNNAMSLTNPVCIVHHHNDHDHIEFMSSCKKMIEIDHTPSSATANAQCNKNDNDNRKDSINSEDYIKMTPNPSYNFKQNYLNDMNLANPSYCRVTVEQKFENAQSTEHRNRNHFQVVPTCIKAYHIPAISHCTHNDDDSNNDLSDSEQSIVMTKNPAYNLKRNFFAEQ